MCLNTITHGTAYAAKYRRDRMKEDNRKDLIQMYDGEKLSKAWVETYEAKARTQFGDETVEEILRG